jgi:RNA polymerase sigma-70 factor (ECF subfamily)
VERLLTRHYDRVYAICRRLAGNDADADDACQEAMMALVRGLERFDGRSSFRTWSYRVATNACLDELRRRSRRPLALVDGSERPDVSTPIDQQVADRVTLDELWTELPEEFRAPVVLRDIVGMDYAEIAQVLDLAPGTVRSRIARGRRHLARLLGNQTPTDERLS